MSSEAEIQKIIGKVDKLPTLPYIVTTLTDLLRSPNTSAADVHKVIMKDQSLSSRILKLVNSAFYGFSERISSISHAIVILGFNTVKNIALTASVFDMFPTEGAGAGGFDRKGFWVHSLACAGTARIIATKARIPNPEDIFVAGLLHDVGKIVLDQFVHEKFATIMQMVADENILIREAEIKVLDGINHSQIGALLATKWKLPSALVQIIAFHHRPEMGDQMMKAISCVHLADILVRSLDIGDGGDKKIPKLNNDAWELLGLTMADVDLIMSKMEDELEETEQLIGEG